VFKGKKMPGQMGNAKVTYSKAEIVDVLPEDNLVLVKGQVPGPKNGIVYLRKQS
jgi:large subunit ribosomal protein L3